MRKIALQLTFAICTIFVSCNDEPKPNCPAPIGEMIAQLNDTTIWEFKYVTYWTESDSSIGIGAGFVNAGCELELSLDFRNILQLQNKQILVKHISEENHPSHLLPHSVFYTWNIDALTERFEIYEDEPSWIQLSEISEEKVTGTFQATYVYRQSAFRFWNLPDTLRFNNVLFEAVLFVPPSE